MVVHFKFSALLQGRPYEYVVRFALGGLATVVAGLVADGAGPEAGGLMLAFPAIFCASATLIEKHERERKEKRGLRRMGKSGPCLFCALHLVAGTRFTARALPRSGFARLVRGRRPHVAPTARTTFRKSLLKFKGRPQAEHGSIPEWRSS
jgi:hypothetical protein